MIHLISRVAAVVLAAAVLGALAASPASAAYGKCSSGEFCLYYNANLTGGVYHFTGSDSTLLNDRFEAGHTGAIVGNQAASASNRGTKQAKDDVVIYSVTGWRGDSDCIQRGDFGRLPAKWWLSGTQHVRSYRWATNAQCSAAGVINLS
jgi:Peptidase inhibitor family I36